MPCCNLVSCYDIFRGYVNPPTIRQPCCCCITCGKGKDCHQSYYENYLEGFNQYEEADKKSEEVKKSS